MKLDVLQRTLRENRLLTVVVLAILVVGTVSGGFALGVFSDQSEKDRPDIRYRLIVDNATAHVTENGTIDRVNLTVRQGTEDVNLSTTTIEWLGPHAGTNLVFATEREVAAGPPDDPYFRAIPIRDRDASAPVMNDQSDRFELVINVRSVAGEQLSPGESVDLKLVTSRRAVTHYTIEIPESVGDQSRVAV